MAAKGNFAKTILACAVLAAQACLAAADLCAEGRAVVYNFDGKTSVVRNRKTIPMDLDMTLRENDVVRTEEDGFVDVTLNGVVGVRVMASSEAHLVNTNEGNMIVRGSFGGFLVNMKALSAGSSFRIVTPTTTVVVKDTRPGTQFLVRMKKNPKGDVTTTVVSEKNTIYAHIETASVTLSVLEGRAIDVLAGNSIPAVRLATEEEETEAGRALSVYVAND